MCVISGPANDCLSETLIITFFTSPLPPKLEIGCKYNSKFPTPEKSDLEKLIEPFADKVRVVLPNEYLTLSALEVEYDIPGPPPERLYVMDVELTDILGTPTIGGLLSGIIPLLADTFSVYEIPGCKLYDCFGDDDEDNTTPFFFKIYWKL